MALNCEETLAVLGCESEKFFNFFDFLFLLGGSFKRKNTVNLGVKLRWLMSLLTGRMAFTAGISHSLTIMFIKGIIG